MEVFEVQIQENEEAEQCRCCLDKNGQRIELWAEYDCDGERENYGEMLSECFSLSSHDPSNTEFICLECIENLRRAYKFRKKILTSNMIQPRQTDENVEPVEVTHIEKENDAVLSTVTVKSEKNNEPSEEVEVREEQYIPKPQSDADDSADIEIQQEEYLEVEYLDEDCNLTTK